MTLLVLFCGNRDGTGLLLLGEIGRELADLLERTMLGCEQLGVRVLCGRPRRLRLDLECVQVRVALFMALLVLSL